MPSSGTAVSSQAESPSFDQLLSQSHSPALTSMGAWLKCLRKPALSVQYSLQKRHVSDLDAEGDNQNQHRNASSAPSGQNSDVMGLDGDFTIRYFDLAMGILGLSMLACLIKGCACIKRIML